MDLDELSPFVIHELSQEADRNDLIMSICQRSGCAWSDAEEFVKRVETENGSQIAQKQFPLLFILALGIFLGGIGLVLYSTITMLEIWNGLSALLNGKPLGTEAYLFLESTIRSGGFPFFAFFLGVAMMLGSLLGMRDVWSSILNRG